ncbi:hypothetical protein [Rickettsia tamurae]|uniref:hypothetical protein n=1 Tax=Rickettsia tamurae TaxID=334545 RepID=UPI000A92E191|nr:hypothetical protein [Rickettsia tamurae]
MNNKNIDSINELSNQVNLNPAAIVNKILIKELQSSNLQTRKVTSTLLEKNKGIIDTPP